MAATILISALLCLFIVWVSYDYSRFKGKMAQYKNQVADYEAKFLQFEEKERKTQLVTTDLQVRLDHAIVDPVTRLSGWQLFEDRLQQSLKESVRYQFTLAVMFIDVDEFKVINNALGYEVGDALLQEIASRLKECIRQVDSISRVAKDTFAIMLPQLGKPETAAIVAQRMLQSIAQPFHLGPHELYASICIGIAVFPQDSQNMTGLLRCADHALRQAKQKGKQNYQFYQEHMNLNAKRELAISNGLRRDSISQEFLIYYQPIMNTRTQTVFGMEALLHWQHPELGLIDSRELYGYATRQGKLNTLSEWLIRHACRQFLHWHTVGFTPEMVGVPVSAGQLENTNFIYRISQILQEMDFKPECLLLEIKSGAVPVSEGLLEKAFNMFNYMGIRLCIDDFGSGLFSLKDLKNFRVQFLKLDPALISGLEDDHALTLLKSIIKLADDLGIRLIASGIEAEQQAALLKKLGCDLMQGTLIGTPVPEKEVV